MIITPEQAALKAQPQFDALRDFVQRAAHEGQRIDTVERGSMRQLLALGHALLSGFVARQGDGDLGPEVEAAGGRTARRLPERHDRRYVSIFGELTITRAAYGTREGQRIERVPPDERLGLPEGDFSYVLEDWGQRLCLKGSFAEAGQSLEMLLGPRVGSRALEQMNRAVASYAPSFLDSSEPPPAWEEGPLMVVTADGKGEKANKKQMACVGAVSSISIEPFVRRAEDIIDEVLRDARAVYFPDAVGVLDPFHVLERLWAVARCFPTEGGDEAKDFVEQRLRDLLRGRVGYVIGGRRRRLKAEKLSGQRREVVRSALEYLGNNKAPMRYDEYLAAGYPIGSGVAEGACRHLVKDRMEQTGMRWTAEGAQATLYVRALYLNDQWEGFHEQRVEREQDRLYTRPAA